jgi:hypothetical protein
MGRSVGRIEGMGLGSWAGGQVEIVGVDEREGSGCILSISVYVCRIQVDGGRRVWDMYIWRFDAYQECSVE